MIRNSCFPPSLHCGPGVAETILTIKMQKLIDDTDLGGIASKSTAPPSFFRP